MLADWREMSVNKYSLLWWTNEFRIIKINPVSMADINAVLLKQKGDNFESPVN